MQAIILAAGMGKRLKELTQDRTKCMVQVNGVALIDRMLHQIESRHLSRIVIVVGYEGEKLMKYIDTLGIRTPIVYVQNPIYDKTNNIYSLALAKDYLCQDDTLLFESDLIFEDAVIDQLLDDPRETLALVDKYESWMDGTCVKLGPDDSIASFVPSKNFRFEEAHEYYKTVNIYKFGRHFSRTHYVPFLEAYSKALGNNEYYEQVLRVIAMLDDPEIRAKRLNGQLWYEIDDIQDLDIASSMFAQDPDLRVSLMQGRYGGYWRYPQLLDFCYLVNPYFPPQRLIDEIQANFTSLLTQYPSGMRVNALLAARNFAVHQQNILVGNGAAELIKALMARLEGVTGFIRPTFEEYPNRYQDRPNVCFTPAGPDFRYTADDLMAFFGPQDIDNLVLINPDNPTGNYIPAPDVLRLADWAQEKGITGGIGNSLFAPNQPCTRSQIVTFLWRVAGSPVVNYLMPFTDVDEGAYYAEAVRWAASEKIVEGTTAVTFAPNATVTRAQVVTMLCRFAKAQGMDTTQGGMAIREFDDFDSVPAYALEAMDWAVNAGVLKGDNNRLMPQNACTRAQIVTFLWRVFSK